MRPKPRMCCCNQCRGYDTTKRHIAHQTFRQFQRKVFNRKFRKHSKTLLQKGNYDDLPNY